MSKVKRAHYVPQVYLNSFVDAAGKLRVYRKGEPTKVLHQAPKNTALRGYYYSQPTPDGGRDENALEAQFSELEGKWPAIVRRLKARIGGDLDGSLGDVFAFMGLQRVRVPACRDATEAMLAAVVKAQLAKMHRDGELPPMPPTELSLDDFVVPINPHESIHGMVAMLQAMTVLYDNIGLRAYHNTSGVGLISSDNPVIWYDDSVPEHRRLPYTLRPGGPINMLFPVGPELLLWGHTAFKDRYGREGLVHMDLTDAALVRSINRDVCRYAYEAVFARETGYEALVSNHAHEAPVLRSDCVPVAGGQILSHQFVFGPRPDKPKWIDKG